jgi:hypothetical protein
MVYRRCNLSLIICCRPQGGGQLHPKAISPLAGFLPTTTGGSNTAYAANGRRKRPACYHDVSLKISHFCFAARHHRRPASQRVLQNLNEDEGVEFQEQTRGEMDNSKLIIYNHRRGDWQAEYDVTYSLRDYCKLEEPREPGRIPFL